MRAEVACPARDLVLVVDDRDESRYTVVRLLRRAGFEVIEATTGQQALELVGQHPAIVILDINLPDLNGLEVCRRIKADPGTSSVLVVHLSASFVTSQDQAHGLSVGADGYLTHPIDPSVLLATVSAFIRIRRTEEELRRTQRELERTIELRNADIQDLKLERDLRERFVSTLTHDLRNPLSAARISAQLLGRPGIDDEGRARASQRMLTSIDRTDGMIQDLLDANRIRAGQPVPLRVRDLDLSGMLRETVAELEGLHGPRVRLALEGDLKGQWDGEALRRVVENLVTNAIKYGSATEPVIVEARGGSDLVEFRVRNQGEPIPAGDLPHLFDQFRRSRRAERGGNEGWGLGLTLVRGIAEAHGGATWVVSTREEGTTFTVRIPRCPPPES